MASTSRQFIYQPPPAEIARHFQTTPWALALFSDPTLQPFTNESRMVKRTNTADTFMSRTLATDDTIIAWQNFHRISPPGGAEKVEIIAILKIGSGVNGHVDICHGGFVSLLLDEVIGTVAEDARPKDKSTMTAYLKVDYKKPVRTPAVVLCRAWVENTEGRKIWGRGTVEDGEGGVLAEGEALFLVVGKVTGLAKL